MTALSAGIIDLDPDLVKTGLGTYRKIIPNSHAIEN
jgi:hypothetical protein